jgi:Uma2 family endonuclease
MDRDMQIDIQPDPEALARWREVLADPELARWPGRIETDRHGHILMSPPPALPHSFHQSRILQLLARLLPKGQSLVECPLLTSDGVKGIDVAWLAPGRSEIADGEPVLVIAPEICVEVVSPGNTAAEMDKKRALYFAAGAREVWVVDTKGAISFFTPEPASHSSICPEA